MRITVLGSGTSTGVPLPGCHCEVCCSKDPLNKRLRTSIHIELYRSGARQNPSSAPSTTPLLKSVLIDTSTDLRYQALRAGIERVDNVFYTHTHADHIYGIDDLRGFSYVQKTPIEAYASDHSATELERIFNYIFSPKQYHPGSAPPKLTLSRIRAYESVNLSGIDFLPLPVMHGPLEVFAYRVGNFAYITDCSFIPDKTMEYLEGLEVLIIDGLRYREHATHFNFSQAVAAIEGIKPKQSYLTHISHDVDHLQGNEKLRKMTERSVELAYDGLTIEV